MNLPTERLPDILRKLAKTAALVTVLGFGLYAVLMFAIDRWMDDGLQYWITLLLLAPSVVMLTTYVLNGLRREAISLRFQQLTRRDNPIGYWFTIIWTSGVIVLLAALMLYALRALI